LVNVDFIEKRSIFLFSFDLSSTPVNSLTTVILSPGLMGLKYYPIPSGINDSRIRKVGHLRALIP